MLIPKIPISTGSFEFEVNPTTRENMKPLIVIKRPMIINLLIPQTSIFLINQINITTRIMTPIIKKRIDGAIQLSAFNCGCDSVIKEFIAEEFKQAKIPYLSLMIDEHTGEAGLLTRIEAFLDSLS